MNSKSNLSPKKSDSEWPEVAIIILNWNNYADTAECLEAIETLDYPNYYTTVVDNGSSDDSIERLQNEFGWCTFLLNEENLGFAAGCNTGIRDAVENESDYVLLLNNDLVIQDPSVHSLVETAENNEKAAIVSGIITESDSGDIWYAGGTLNLLSSKSKLKTTKQDSEEYSTGFVTGAMMLLSTDFLRQYGYLDETYFFGGEDREICLRAIRQGLELMVNPDAKAVHKVSSTSGDRNPFSYYHSTINSLILSNKYLSGFSLIAFYCIFTCSRLVRIIQWLLMGQHELASSVILAYQDYLRGTVEKRTNLL